MNIRHLIIVYSITLFLSAALLFSVQPLFSKMILPLLGGSSQVWTTAMLFFQLFLLAGYAYAHYTSHYLDVKIQVLLHGLLFVMFLVVLPLSIPSGWRPPADGNPALWQAGIMTLRLGGPFFVLSAMAPMLQHWFARTGHPDADNPYFLYAASNLGSMTALLSYPFIIEPLWTLPQQSHFWSLGYVALFALMLFCALPARHARRETATMSTGSFISWRLRGAWLLLAFIPSSLMLGVTTFITTDVASVPLLWILPLALYVGTFIIAFARRSCISENRVWLWQGIAFIFVLVPPISSVAFLTFNAAIAITSHLILFFLTALACHMRLVSLRPRAIQLTEFYMIMSLGGALGGVFNALLAPVIFVTPLEYPLILLAVAFLRYTGAGENLNTTGQQICAYFKARGLDGLFRFDFIGFFVIVFFAGLAFANAGSHYHYIAAFFITVFMVMFLRQRWAFAASICVLMLFFMPGDTLNRINYKKIVLKERNFYGVLKVVDTEEGERFLLHGTTNHGAQALEPPYVLTPISYYGADSPVQDAFEIMNRRRGKQDVAVVGLGIGVTACFKKQGRHFDFFEIDPDVVKIADDKALFTYLSDCGSPYDIILGDGRLKMAAQRDQKYDLILIDVYSSDNIPVHMITKEAVGLYLQKLKKDGVIVFNISNKFLDIEPVLTNIAADLGISGLARVSEGGALANSKIQYYPAHYFVMTENALAAKSLVNNGWTAGMSRTGVGIWTDRYSNIIGVLGNKIAIERGKKAQN
ncbi:MAG: spermidine synthase [Alphaproteobacteria bacterium]